ncbi:MAG TPA: hypothetical protein VGM17_09760 [Rhizomicrobium sp.]
MVADVFASAPEPPAGDHDEIRIWREQIAEARHSLCIPAFRKGIDDRTNGRFVGAIRSRRRYL